MTSPKSGGQPAKMKRCNSSTATSSEDDAEFQMRPRDLLDMMLFNGTWTDLELRDEAFIFFVAGHETTAVTLAWILAHISADHVLQQRLREEMLSVLGHGALQKGTENQLPLLTNTIKEGLRMYPPAFAFTRFVEEEVAIDGAKIPAGYDVMLNIIGMQRNPAYSSGRTSSIQTAGMPIQIQSITIHSPSVHENALARTSPGLNRRQYCVRSYALMSFTCKGIFQTGQRFLSRQRQTLPCEYN